ncbi:MAG: UDP-N-acetylglucosamine 2-epimerase (non-hydrolyzing) [Clostridia bacterium]|nr:UDP-N-acetylglucosamine 2-epimerase (non-hydrolyzing) [Clostridia bacterium]
MTAVRVAAVFGTRPEAIKMAPVVRALQEDPSFEVRLLVTGQHRELLDAVLACFDLAPDADLDLLVPGQPLAELAARALDGVARALRAWGPALVLTHGDTATTVAAALAAFYEGIPSGHVEAGLRSGDRWEPYPEEMDRRIADQLADLLFAPTERARRALLAEGAEPERVFVTGNTAIDALLHTKERVEREGERAPWPASLSRVDWSRRVVVVETHRRENWQGAIAAVARAVGAVVRARPDVEVVYSVHPNPVVREAVSGALSGTPRVHLCEPLDYPTWVRLLSRCEAIVSDSGGLQEEAPALGKPLVVTRRRTERPEAAEAGTALLVGTEADDVRDALLRVLDDDELRQRMSRVANPFGDGKAAARIRDAIRFRFGLGPRPRDFRVEGGAGAARRDERAGPGRPREAGVSS